MEYGKLEPPTAEALKVFENLLKGNPEADMRAIPNQWLLRERALSSQLGDRILELQQQVEALTQDRNLIADYLASDPPFDECAGIDIYERAAFYSAEIYAEESSPDDYYRAFMDCVRAAQQGDE